MNEHDPDEIYNQNKLNLDIKDKLERTYQARKKSETRANRLTAPAFLAPIIGAYALIKYGNADSRIEEALVAYFATYASIIGGVGSLAISEEHKSQAHIAAAEARDICDGTGINRDRWITDELD